MNYLLVVDDEAVIRTGLRRLLERHGYQVAEAGSVDEALQQSLDGFDLIISDLRLPGLPGTALIEHAGQTPVLIMTSFASIRSAVDAVRAGAADYIAKPFDHDDLLLTVERILRERLLQRQNAALRQDISRERPATGIIGSSPAMQELHRRIQRMASLNTTVLIHGESGTGKELVARALHYNSPRRDRPLVTINCAALQETLLESELFGHEKGAFTGAQAARAGAFEQASGGTLFLDEIGDMPLDTQTRLLRVLADGEFYRVGGHIPVRVDVRIIAATHQNLEKLVADGKFREDLFHRLNVIRVHIPRLRDRSEDIPRLASFFMSRAAAELQVEPKSLTAEAAQYLQQLPWPGNVRQLENTCRWLTVMASSREVLISDLPPELQPGSQQDAPVGAPNWEQALASWARRSLMSAPEVRLLDVAAPTFERILIQAALHHTGGRRRDAAVVLGWGRNTLTRKIKELGLSVADDEDEDG